MYNEHHLAHVNKHKTKMIIIVIFLLLVFLVVYTSVFGGFSFIGKTILRESDSLNNTIEISASLDKTSLSLSGEFSKIDIRGSSASFLSIGEGKFPLEASENFIIIENFEGDIFFNQEEISKLKGKASQISINGVPVLPDSKETIKINLDETIFYNFLKINDGIFIKELDYKTSGEIELIEKGSFFHLDEDNILIKNFQGSLTVENQLNFKGNIESLDIKGKQRISISSDNS
jgi:hypothetical protein